jgi:hypothetical protein
MPTYSCECCDYSTHIKTLYTRHTSTTKHQNNINKPPIEGVATTKEIVGTLEMLCEEIVNLKKDNAEIRRALQECKQLIMDMKTHLAYT